MILDSAFCLLFDLGGYLTNKAVNIGIISQHIVRLPTSHLMQRIIQFKTEHLQGASIASCVRSFHFLLVFLKGSFEGIRHFINEVFGVVGLLAALTLHEAHQRGPLVILKCFFKFVVCV